MVTAPDSVDVPVIAAFPLTASVLLNVTVPVIVAFPPTASVLLNVTAPVTAAVPATVKAPSPFTENISTAFELACVRAESNQQHAPRLAAHTTPAPVNTSSRAPLTGRSPPPTPSSYSQSAPCS